MTPETHHSRDQSLLRKAEFIALRLPDDEDDSPDEEADLRAEKQHTERFFREPKNL